MAKANKKKGKICDLRKLKMLYLEYTILAAVFVCVYASRECV